jgi:hypothetical protein
VPSPDLARLDLPSRTCTLPIAGIVRDDRLRYRDAAHKAVGPVQEYAAAMAGDPDADPPVSPSWDQFPRIVCIDLTEPYEWTEEVPAKGALGKPRKVRLEYPAGTTLLVGGFTRCEAADLAGVTHAPAVVYSGTWADARRLAWRENTHHGARRSRMETDRVLLDIHLDPKYAGWSIREVASLAGCTYHAVQAYRSEVGRKEREFIESQKRADAFAAANSPPPPPPPPAGPPPASPPPPTTPTAASGAVPSDAWKRPLPDGLVEPFEAVGPMAKLLRSMRATALEAARMKHGADGRERCLTPGLVKADVQGLLLAVTTGCDGVEADLPFLVCPECDGVGKCGPKGCKLCGGLGWVGKAEADRFTPAQEKVAAKFRGAQ